MWCAICIAVAVYLFVGYLWGGFLSALTSGSDGRFPWRAFLHGLFWPLSMLRVL